MAVNGATAAPANKVLNTPRLEVLDMKTLLEI